MTLSEVRSAMLKKLAESGLDAADARRLKLLPMTAPPAEIYYRAAGFQIPYYSFAEKKFNGFYRYRYLEPILDKKGKLIRYSQPAKAKPRAYRSRLYDWAAYAARAPEDRRLIITEGELKANCAAKHELPCVGLGGVWNFKYAENSLLPELAELDWSGVSVHIVYDSDARSNPNVLMAENALAKELLARGALVYIVRLPELVEGRKTGLDDYVETKGVDEFVNLLLDTKPWEASRKLHELNEKVIFLHNPGDIMELRDFQRMSAEKFSRSIFANWVWEETVQLNNGKTKTTKKNAAVEWVHWPARAEVTAAVYAPGEPSITEKRELNTWRGWGLKDDDIKPGDVSLWLQLLDYLLAEAEPAHRRWFEQWLAYPLQHPGTKLFSAIVMWGLQHGTGKTLVGHTMRELYGRNFNEIEERDLLGAFNAWAENRQFVMGDEITGDDKRSSSDRMKSVITRTEMTINVKYISPYTVRDCINYYFTSNHPDSFFLDDSDRRYFIHEVRGEPLPLDFYRRYDEWYRTPAVGAVMHRLMNLDLTGFSPTAPAPATASKRQMIQTARTDAGAWVEELREHPESVVPDTKLTLLTLEALFHLWDPLNNKRLTRPGLSRELKRGGFRQVHRGEPVRLSTTMIQRLWIVGGDRKKLERMNPKEIAAVYHRERGTKYE